MIVGSIKEDLSLEKRVSLTPETAKNILGLGLKVCVEKNYASHIGIQDKDYLSAGVEIKKNRDILSLSDQLSDQALHHINNLIKVIYIF